jgi:diguanylate cyclase (GGDEF)-like protein
VSALLSRPANRVRQTLQLILKVRNHNPELRRRGQTLAIVLFSLLMAGFTLTIFNIVRGEAQYHAQNSLFISLVLGLFVLNRFGFVRTASVFTVALTAAGAFLMSEENLTTTYIAMPLPVLIASYMLPSWSAFLVAALMIVGAVVFGIASPSLLILIVVAVFSYLFANSLNRLYRENLHRALHDELTGLPNRTLFVDHLQQAIDRLDNNRNHCAVLFLDLDGFKVVNDSLGHEAGDDLLIMTAQRLRSCLRRGDSAARFGGDEFAALLDNVVSVDEAVRVAERIAVILEAPFELRGRQVFLSTSVGIALREDGDEHAVTLLRNADVAMYKAKQKGTAGYEVFNAAMYAEVLERLELENDLRHAIDRGELKVLYQPKVLLSTGEITGMEALIRWEHPERGVMRPEQFIPLAEEVGFIVPLGRWVLREACHQAYQWCKQYPTTPPLVTSVNLSVKQFQEPNLIHELTSELRLSELDPRCLQLEITESMVMSNIEHAVSLLRKLKELGVGLAIDDFGTGYSSLVALRQFPLDRLKINKSFVDGVGKDAEDTAIVQLVINLAHAVGMQATAEGVETADQLAHLRAMECDEAQGYYFSEPLTGEAATALLAGRPHRPIDQHYSTEHSRNPRMLDENQAYSDPE